MNEDLLKKVKAGLAKSGFPLEIEIGRLLEKNKWLFSTSNPYIDFETGKLRESDISASKMINGVSVHLIIECKKYSDKQIVLYCPNTRKYKRNVFFWAWLRGFPKPLIFPTKERGPIHDMLDVFQDLEIFDLDRHFAKNIIFTKGDKVLQENQSFFSSLNGMLKEGVNNRVQFGNDSSFRNKRVLYFYLLVVDGVLLQFLPSVKDDFTVEQIEYGQYEMTYNFKILPEFIETYLETAKAFEKTNIIEMMNPNYFEKYILNLEKTVDNFDKEKLKEWGEDW